MSDVPRTLPAYDPKSFPGVLRALVDGGVEFVVCGGVACIMQGVNRTTADVDIAARLTTENLSRLIEVVKKLGMMPRIPEPIAGLLDPVKRRDWVEKKGATVYTLVWSDHPFQVDVFLQYPIDFDDLKARANVLTWIDVELLVSSRADLIAAKKIAGRTQDLSDIRELEKIIHDKSREQID